MTKQEEKELQTLERLSKLGTMDAGSQARLARLRAASSNGAASGVMTGAQSAATGGTQNIYQQTLAAADPTFSTVNYDNVLKRGVDEGFRVANDDDKALWQQIIAAQNAGDTAAVTNLLNSMRAQGNFSGYYGDDGLYYGFARGYGGAAGNSYQPVIGGKLIASGNTDTDQWLTPDGKAYSGNLGGSLSSAGVWSYGDPKQMASVPSTKNYGTTKAPSGNGVDSAPAAYSPEGGKIAQKIQPVESAPQGIGSFSDGTTSSGTPTGSNPYIEMMDQAAGQTTATTPQPVTSQAPTWEGGDFDWRDTPEYKEFVDKYSNAESPAWNDEFDWTQSPDYIAFMEKYGEAEAPEYEGSQYDPMRDAALEKAKNPFSYDLNRDPAWQAYQKQYRREGQRAYQDTLANAAARTGGKASSYAVSAANQAGNYYNAQMTDKIPQLYQDAYNRYLSEYQKQMGLASQYNQMGQQDYTQYLNRLQQWNTDRDEAYGRAQDSIANYRKDYDTRYQQYLDELEKFYTDRGFSYDQAQAAIAQARKDYDTQYQQHLDELDQWRNDRDFQYKTERDAVADAQWNAEFQQRLTEWAAEQGWKAKDWEQYAREYDDKLTQQQKEWIYQQQQDALDREMQQAKFDYTKEQNALDWQRQNMLDQYNMDEDAYNRQLNEAKLAIQYYGDYSRLAALLGIDTTGMNSQQIQYVLTDRRLIDPDTGDVDEEAVEDAVKRNRYKQAPNTPDYKKAITDFNDNGISIVNDTYAETPSASHAYANIGTWRQAHDYLTQHGIGKSKYSIMNETTFNDQKNNKDSDAYGYSTYQAYLQDYVAYIMESYGGAK